MALRHPPFQSFDEMCSSYRLSCLRLERSGSLSPAQAIEVGVLLGLHIYDRTYVAFQYNLGLRIQHLEGPGDSERWTFSGWVLEWIPSGSVAIDGFELQYGLGTSESIFNSASEAIRSSDWFDGRAGFHARCVASALPTMSTTKKGPPAFQNDKGPCALAPPGIRAKDLLTPRALNPPP